MYVCVSSHIMQVCGHLQFHGGDTCTYFIPIALFIDNYANILL